MPEVYRFETFGPFAIKRKNSNVSPTELKKLWPRIESIHPGLPRAQGVYLLTIRSANQRPIPWYVGKTERGFEKRISDHAKVFAQIADDAPEGSLELVLIARMQAKKRAFKDAKSKSSIDRLETMLIGACLTANPIILNKKKTSLINGLEVPGFMGRGQGDTEGALFLREVLA